MNSCAGCAKKEERLIRTVILWLKAGQNRNTYASYYEVGIDSMFDFAFADTGGIIANTLKGSYGCQDYVMHWPGKEGSCIHPMNQDLCQRAVLYQP